MNMYIFMIAIKLEVMRYNYIIDGKKEQIDLCDLLEIIMIKLLGVILNLVYLKI